MDGRSLPRDSRPLLGRLWRHRWLDAGDVRRALPDAAMQRLQDAVAASEAGHSGEIRLCIEAGLPWSYLRRRAPARERALAMFGKLRVWDTEANNGVLIYLLLADHAIELVVDRGLSARVPAQRWQQIVAELSAALRAGQYEQGLAQAVAAVDALLRAHFPVTEGQRNPNELPDAPHVQG